MQNKSDANGNRSAYKECLADDGKMSIMCNKKRKRITIKVCYEMRSSISVKPTQQNRGQWKRIKFRLHHASEIKKLI